MPFVPIRPWGRRPRNPCDDRNSIGPADTATLDGNSRIVTHIVGGLGSGRGGAVPERRTRQRRMARSLAGRCRMILRCAGDPPNKQADARRAPVRSGNRSVQPKPSRLRRDIDREPEKPNFHREAEPVLGRTECRSARIGADPDNRPDTPASGRTSWLHTRPGGVWRQVNLPVAKEIELSAHSPCGT